MHNTSSTSSSQGNVTIMKPPPGEKKSDETTYLEFSEKVNRICISHEGNIAESRRSNIFSLMPIKNSIPNFITTLLTVFNKEKKERVELEDILSQGEALCKMSEQHITFRERKEKMPFSCGLSLKGKTGLILGGGLLTGGITYTFYRNYQSQAAAETNDAGNVTPVHNGMTDSLKNDSLLGGRRSGDSRFKESDREYIVATINGKSNRKKKREYMRHHFQPPRTVPIEYRWHKGEKRAEEEIKIAEGAEVRGKSASNEEIENEVLMLAGRKNDNPPEIKSVSPAREISNTAVNIFDRNGHMLRKKKSEKHRYNSDLAAYDIWCEVKTEIVTFPSILRNIGQSLEYPLSYVIKQVIIIFWRDILERGCPDRSVTETIEKVLNIMDIGLRLSLATAIAPANAPLTALVFLIGPILQAMADDIEGKEIDFSARNELITNIAGAFRIDITTHEGKALFPDDKGTINYNKLLEKTADNTDAGLNKYKVKDEEITRIKINNEEFDLHKDKNENFFVYTGEKRKYVYQCAGEKSWNLLEDQVNSDSHDYNRINAELYAADLFYIFKNTKAIDKTQKEIITVIMKNGNVSYLCKINDHLVMVKESMINENKLYSRTSGGQVLLAIKRGLDNKVILNSEKGWTFEKASVRQITC